MNTRKSEKIIQLEPVTLNKEQAKDRYNLGETFIDKIAKEIGASIKVGRRKLYLRKKLDMYFENLTEENSCRRR